MLINKSQREAKYQAEKLERSTETTIETLKADRINIISHIKYMREDVNVSEVMKSMINHLELSNNCTNEEFVEVILDTLFQEKYSNEASIWLADKNRENAIKNSPSSLR